MIQAVRYAIWIVAAHALVASLHGVAHLLLNIPLSSLQNLFIIIVIVISPLAAALLLWKRYHIWGAVVLFGSMAGSLVFGVYNHLCVSGPDHIFSPGGVSSGAWATVFRITAVLLAVTELPGCLVGAWMLKPSGFRQA
jgi:hypothetical protein